MGGEPLCQENAFLTTLMVKTVREKYPNIKIYVWTGYTWDEIQKNHNNPKLRQICDAANYLITGPYIAEERDITLPMRGSRNQEIIDLSEVELEHE
jgi:anaerobic ribonucleoside-triphosphate reductase activating protein